MDRNFRDHSRKVVTRVAAAFKCIQETSASDTFKQLASKSNKLSLLLTRRTEALVAEVEENSLSLSLPVSHNSFKGSSSSSKLVSFAGLPIRTRTVTKVTHDAIFLPPYLPI